MKTRLSFCYLPRPEFTFLHWLTSVAQKTQNLRSGACKMGKNKLGIFSFSFLSFANHVFL